MKLPTKAALVAFLGDLALILGPLAALPYTMGDIADILPPKAKAAMTVFCAVCAVLLKFTQRLIERHQGKKDELGIETAIMVAKEAAGVPPISDGVKDFVREAMADKWACDKAPSGWACTRRKGHDGPCAAVKLGLVLFCLLMLSGCATKVNYPNGRTAFWSTSDFTEATFTTKALTFHLRGHRPSYTIQKTGAATTQIVGAAGAAAIIPGL